MNSFIQSLIFILAPIVICAFNFALLVGVSILRDWADKKAARQNQAGGVTAIPPATPLFSTTYAPAPPSDS